MKQTLTLLITIILLSSCTRDLIPILDAAEEQMQARPDSSFALLGPIDIESISSRGNKARYALLYSMALDKNATDVTNDSLISIATEWYANHGAPDERLNAYYYHGRVLQNARNNEKAMEYFVEAETFAAKASDDYAKGLLYNAMANVYMDSSLPNGGIADSQ